MIFSEFFHLKRGMPFRSYFMDLIEINLGLTLFLYFFITKNIKVYHVF